MSELGTLDPSQLYRRQARRIRGQCVGRPEQLYRSLRQLSDRHDAMAAKKRSARMWQRPASEGGAGIPACLESESLHHQFAQFVADRLEGTILRYSTRLELLQIAADLGISRFQANLMIAAVQYQLGDETTQLPDQQSRSGWPLIMAAVLMLQSGIVLAAWKLFAR